MAILLSENILKKYPDIGKYLSIVYNEGLQEYSVYTVPTEHFYVKDLSEITEERIEAEIKKENEKKEFRNIFFPEDWKDGDIQTAILRSLHSRL